MKKVLLILCFLSLKAVACDTLTITGISTVVQFADTREIGRVCNLTIVPGGRVVLQDGAKLTSLLGCPNSEWEGIYVIGNNPNTLNSQSTSNDGILHINTGTIENARNAVVLGMATAYSLETNLPVIQEDLGYGTSGGGILEAKNATFLNNRRSVWVTPFVNHDASGNEIANKSYLQSCTFSITNTMPISRKFTEFVYLNTTSFVSIKGTTFSNSRTTLHKTNEDLGVGILAVDAAFGVKPFCLYASSIDQTLCAQQKNCSFSGLMYGVRVQKQAYPRIYTVDQADFDKCLFGVKNEAVNMAIVTRNHFTIGNFILPNDLNYGFFSEGAALFQANENIYTAATTSISAAAMGDAIYESGPNTSILRKNTYHGNLAGSYALYNNRQTISTDIGLKYECNIHQNNTGYDIIPLVVNQPNDGVAFNQGSPFIPAGNTFSNPTTYPNASIFYFDLYPLSNSSAFMNYYFDNTILGAEPLYTTSNVTKTSIRNHISCNSHYLPTPSDGAGIKWTPRNPTVFLGGRAGKVAYYEQNNYQAIISGNSLATNLENGSNIDLNAYSSYSYSAELQAIRSELLAQSPYLSTDVLRNLIDNMGTDFPIALVMEVVAANPDALRIGLFDYLESTPMENEPWRMALLQSLKDNMSERTYLEEDYNAYSTNATLAAQAIYLDVATAPEADEPLLATEQQAWLLKINQPAAAYDLVDVLLYKGEFETAMQKMNDIKDYFKLSDVNLEQHNLLADYYTLMHTVAIADTPWMAADENSINQLYALAATPHPIVATRALNTIQRYFSETYHHYPHVGDMPTAKKQKTPRNYSALDLPTIKQYPMPADAYTIIQHNEQAAGTLTLMDMAGKTISTQPLQKVENWVDTHSLPDGVYLYTIRMNTGISSAGKIIVQHQK